MSAVISLIADRCQSVSEYSRCFSGYQRPVRVMESDRDADPPLRYHYGREPPGRGSPSHVGPEPILSRLVRERTAMEMAAMHQAMIETQVTSIKRSPMTAAIDLSPIDRSPRSYSTVDRSSLDRSPLDLSPLDGPAAVPPHENLPVGATRLMDRMMGKVELEDGECPRPVPAEKSPRQEGEYTIPIPGDVLRRPDRQCQVCGDQAAGSYFGALVCIPCKVSCQWANKYPWLQQANKADMNTHSVNNKQTKPKVCTICTILLYV